MRKIEKFEDMIGEGRLGSSKDDHIVTGGLKKLDDEGITFLPCDDPTKGEFGHIGFRSDANDFEILLTTKVFDEPESITYDDFDTFKNKLESHLEKDYPVFVCDDAKKLRIGFLTLKNSGNEWHNIHLGVYKGRNDSNNE